MTNPDLTGRPSRLPLRVAVLLAGLLALGVYLLTLAPSATWRHEGADSGELAAAAAVLGVPHPSGYPTWTLLAWLFHWVPVGELGRRVALLSAVSAALAIGCFIGLLATLMNRWPAAPAGLRRPVAVSVGLAAAFAPAFWSQAILAEVYALHAFFVTLLLALAFWQPARLQTQRRRWPALAFLSGLGLGNHLLLVLVFPILIYLGLRARHAATAFSDPPPAGREHAPQGTRAQGSFPSLLTLLLCFLSGLLVYLYLPWAAARDPAVAWGDPTTAGGFWWLVSGQLYRGALLALPWPDLPARLSAWGQLLLQQFTWPGLALAAWGLWRLETDDRPLWWMTLWLFVAYSVYALGYATVDSFVYLLPAYLAVSVWLARGLPAAWTWLEARIVRLLPRLQDGRVGWLALLLPLVLLASNWSAVDLSHDTAAREYAQEALAAVPRGALIVTSGDAHTFALWYVQAGLDERPDVTLIERTLWNFDWYRHRTARRDPTLDPAAGPEIGLLILAQRGRRPVYLSDPDEDLALRFDLMPAGVLWRVAERPAE